MTYVRNMTHRQLYDRAITIFAKQSTVHNCDCKFLAELFDIPFKDVKIAMIEEWSENQKNKLVNLTD